ncbi:MAG: hypothetical protein JNM63_15530 [Spirochaetia bacterium]|nr:hypothetical protein [Spirochaetia bacterium]
MSNSEKSLHPIRPLRFYVAIVSSLLLLTAVSVVIHLLELGVWSSVLTIVVASVQALIVVLFSMGLRYEKGFTMIFVAGSFLFLIFFVALTLADVVTRGDMFNKEHRNYKIKTPVKPMGQGTEHHSGEKKSHESREH